jgi:hypothetical protein
VGDNISLRPSRSHAALDEFDAGAFVLVFFFEASSSAIIRSADDGAGRILLGNIEAFSAATTTTTAAAASCHSAAGYRIVLFLRFDNDDCDAAETAGVSTLVDIPGRERQCKAIGSNFQLSLGGRRHFEERQGCKRYEESALLIL